MRTSHPATHSSELQYIFDQPNAPIPGTLDADQQALAAGMRTAGASFRRPRRSIQTIAGLAVIQPRSGGDIPRTPAAAGLDRVLRRTPLLLPGGRIGRPRRRRHFHHGSGFPDEVQYSMIRNDGNGRHAQGCRADVVAIVTGGSSGTGREVARALTSWGWAIVIVYLEHQRTAEATVEEILAAGGNVVAVRADPADDLDVQRLFAETTAAFAGVDVVVHTTTCSASLLYENAARHVRARGADRQRLRR